MIRLIYLLLLMLVSLLAQAQSTEVRKVSKFDKIAVSNAIQVIVQTDVDGDVIVESNQASNFKNVITEVRSQTLIISLEGLSRRQSSFGPIRVYVSQKKLTGFYGEAGGSIKLTKRYKGGIVSVFMDSSADMQGDLSVTQLNLNLDSAGSFSGDVSAGTIKANIDSAGKASLTGDAESLVLNIDSSGRFLGSNLKLKKAKIVADSMGKAEVHVSENLDAYADSMGSVIYWGNPKTVKKSTDSMGSIKAK